MEENMSAVPTFLKLLEGVLPNARRAAQELPPYTYEVPFDDERRGQYVASNAPVDTLRPEIFSGWVPAETTLCDYQAHVQEQWFTSGQPRHVVAIGSTWQQAVGCLPTTVLVHRPPARRLRG
jgi:hypothetical protein